MLNNPSRGPLALLTLIGLFAMLVVGRPVFAAPPAAEAPLAASSPEGHGWLVIPPPPLTDTEDRASDPEAESAQPAEAASGPVRAAGLIVHIPPRDATGDRGAPVGSAKIVRRLVTKPVAMAARGRELVLFFPPREDQAYFRVLAVRAGVETFGGAWTFEPYNQFDTYEPLPPCVTVIRAAVVDTTMAVHALVEDGSPVVFLSRGRGWDTAAAGDVDRLVAEIERHGPLDVGSLGARVAIDLSDGSLTPALTFDSGQRVVFAAAEGSPEGPPFAVAIDGPQPRLVAFWYAVVAPALDAGSGGIAAGRPDVMAAEWALDTGRVLYAGRSVAPAAVSATAYRFLALGIMMIMAACVVVAVLPAPDEGVAALPPDTALAPNGLRLFASVLDAAIVALVVSKLSGIPLASLLGPELMVGDQPAWTLIPGIMIAGVSYAAAMETVFGWTVGKLACGLRVTRIGESAVTPGFAPSIARNAVKWVLTPVAMLMLFDDSGRHRGDVFARAAVVVEPRQDADEG